MKLSRPSPFLSFSKLGLLLSLSSQLQATPIDPSERAERKFHTIYKKLNLAPTAEEAWKKVLEQGKTQSYLVTKGDTLWDISETLFGDPQFYPKIWSLNSDDVFNPHEILPEQMIQFTEGTMGSPPVLSVRASENSPALPVGPDPVPPAVAVIEPDGNVATTEIPGPIVLRGKSKKVPNSFPQWDLRSSLAVPYELDLAVPRSEGLSAQSVLNFAVEDQSLESLGDVVETELALKSAGNQHLIFVKMKTPPTQSRFTVVRKVGEVADPTHQRKGVLMEYQGQIEIQEVVNEKQLIYRAQVRQALSQVQVGSQLISSEIPTLNPEGETQVINHSAQVIGGQFEEGRKIFGKDDILFINSGSSEGLVVGQSMPIYKSQISRFKETVAIQNPRPIAQIKIVKTSLNFATAIVTSSLEEIMVGDSTSPLASQVK